jgi:hypothetical protein
MVISGAAYIVVEPHIDWTRDAESGAMSIFFDKSQLRWQSKVVRNCGEVSVDVSGQL